MRLGITIGIPGMPDVGGALGGAAPSAARVTTSGAYRVTTDGAYRVWTAAPPLPDALLDLRVSDLSLSEADPASTWTNTRGTAGGSFTQSGSARPTYRANAGHPYLAFDGVDDYMTAGAAINTALDNLPSFTIFLALQRPATFTSGFQYSVSKLYNGGAAGWSVSGYGVQLLLQEDLGNNWVQAYGEYPALPDGSLSIITWEITALDFSGVAQYRNGAQTGGLGDGSWPPVANISTAEPVRLGTDGAHSDFYDSGIAAIRIYAPAPNASDRAAIEADMAADTGITL